MEDLEFRAWIIDQKRMIYNIGLELPCVKIIEYEDVEKADYLLMAPRRIAEYGTGLVKIMQYTGLHDNTKWESLLWHDREKWLRYHTAQEWCGRKIYEHDIVSDCNLTFVVKWSSSQFGYVIESKMESCQISEYLSIWRDYKKIGNIYENPGLIPDS